MALDNNDFSNTNWVSPRPYRGSVSITPGAEQAARNGIQIVCTGAGDVSLKMEDDSTNVVPVAVGLTILPYAVKTVNTAGTTATATIEISPDECAAGSSQAGGLTASAGRSAIRSSDGWAQCTILTRSPYSLAWSASNPTRRESS